jgi:hypothetical protein
MVKKLPLAITLVLTFISVMPLLKSGLPPTHDGEYHVIRFYEFYKTLTDGHLYPRWAPDLNYGFGVPLFNFVYPLPNYVASLLHFFGFSFIDSFKFNMVLASFVGAVFTYLWSKGFYGKLGGLISSVLYTYSPYHFLDIYIRGSVGEVWALGLFPAFLWSITKYIKEQEKRFAIISSVVLALVIFSHNILALMFFPFALLYIIFLTYQSKERRHLIFNAAYIILLGLGLSSIFWLPALLERQFVRGLEVFDYSFHFPEIYELIIPSWGSGFSGGSLRDTLSFQIGIANLLALVLSLVAVILGRKNKERSWLSLFFLGWFFLTLFLMLSISKPLWQNVPFINYFQFPWRFLSLEILIISFLAGNIVYLRKGKVITWFIVSLSFLLGIGYTGVAYYHQRDDGYYTKRSNFIDGTNSPGNAFNTIWFKDINKREESKLTLSEGIIKSQNLRPTNYSFVIMTGIDQKATINTAYFPGWKAYVDEKVVDTETTDKGLFSFDLKKRESKVDIKFEDTNIRKLSTLVFTFSLLIAFFKLPFFATIKR